jgi:tetratricopeptide (TPR) repeat protein
MISAALAKTPGQQTPEELREHLVALATDLRAAVAHHRAGKLEEAEALYRKLLDAAPNHPQALRLLGVIETERGQATRGVELIGRAFPALSSIPDAHLDFGNALRLAGKSEQAVESYRRALALKPDHLVAHTRLAALLTELGRFEAAITHCQAAIAVERGFLPARVILAVALKGADRLPEAADAWREVIALAPDQAESYNHLALELADLGLFAEALYCHDRAVALQPDNPAFHCSRGHTLMHLQDGEKAAAAFRRVIALSPDSKPGWSGLGWALRVLGRFDEADACVKRLREIDPADLLSIRHLPSAGKRPHDAAEIERLTLVVDAADSKADDRIAAGFALGRMLDVAGRFDEAFSRYAAANALVRQTWSRNGDSFDAKSFARYVDRLMATFTPESLANAAASGNVSELPVFVVGMPRSGTTMVEQICASHSRIFGAGELNDIPRIAIDLGRERGDESSKVAARRKAADAHILRLHRLGQGAVRVVDKLPDNILNVGLIAQLFPRARIIYCSRDARDISLSCYFQLFSDGAQYFSYDLADCGRRCREVQRLAAHWLRSRSLHMIEVNYENLVADLEAESRRLIEFLGLDWEPGCLDFHRTERTVATVSHWQVRQPLYSNSVGRWRNYEKHLAPLLAALNDSTEVQATTNTTAAPRT